MPRLTAIRKQALDEMMKNALFEASVAVLSEHGAEGMTMDRVALAASMAKGSLYRYFRSKQELLEFIHAKLVDPIFVELDGLEAKDLPALEKLSGQLRSMLEHVARHAQVHRLLFEDDAALKLLHSSKRRTIQAASQRLAGVFRQGIAEGVFRSADPQLLANMYLGVCRAVLHSQPDLSGPEQREAVYLLILGTFLHGIATDAGRVI